MNIIELKGFIRDISYDPQLTTELNEIPLNDFNVNTCPPYGIISLDEHNKIAYSKWVSPKRTRSYPFARIYNTLGTNFKKITIIPIIKDEGADSSNNDRINAITFSWMNLLNIYIILSWYENADKTERRGKSNLITNQKMNNEHILKKIKEIKKYKMTALHWNTTHFENEFEKIYKNAVNSYSKISISKNVKLHPFKKHIDVLEQFKDGGKFSIQKFKEYTLKRSKEAQKRELMTVHELEHLSDGCKGLFILSNYLGGEYYLTCDEVYIENGIFIIQESKNTKGKLPSIDDIKDGLFKLALYSNIEKLEYMGNEIKFKTRLKLTGNLDGMIKLPSEDGKIDKFIQKNNLLKRHTQIIKELQKEAEINNIEIIIEGNKNG
jgi:hypothetical protein